MSRHFHTSDTDRSLASCIECGQLVIARKHHQGGVLYSVGLFGMDHEMQQIVELGLIGMLVRQGNGPPGRHDCPVELIEERAKPT